MKPGKASHALPHLLFQGVQAGCRGLQQKAFSLYHLFSYLHALLLTPAFDLPLLGIPRATSLPPTVIDPPSSCKCNNSSEGYTLRAGVLHSAHLGGRQPRQNIAIFEAKMSSFV